eukprot:6824884-Pyramimonas_sp.AAC.1
MSVSSPTEEVQTGATCACAGGRKGAGRGAGRGVGGVPNAGRRQVAGTGGVRAGGAALRLQPPADDA